MPRTQRILSAFGMLMLIAVALLALAGTAAWAQEEIPACPPVQVGQELRELPSLSAVNGLLSTTFRVELRRQCVPVLSGSWSNVSMNLRTYVWQPDPFSLPRWGFPGPTLRLRKPKSPNA